MVCLQFKSSVKHLFSAIIPKYIPTGSGSCPSTSQLDLSKNYSYSIKPCMKNLLRNNYAKI